jgi:hypothetical protein
MKKASKQGFHTALNSPSNFTDSSPQRLKSSKVSKLMKIMEPEKYKDEEVQGLSKNLMSQSSLSKLPKVHLSNVKDQFT